jgi:succinoglycan biosynthesis transport protein ExoP
VEERTTSLTARARPEGAELRRALEIARRRWRLGITVLLIPLAAAVGLTLFLPRIYRASTVILVDRQQVPESFVRSTVTSAPETRLQSIGQEVLKRGRLEELIERFDLYPDLRASKPMETVTDQMRRDIQIERVMDPVVRGGAIVSFTVSYTGRDPATVADVVNTLAAAYLAENSRVRGEEASGTAGFLRKQLQEVKQRLEDQEGRVSAFKRRYIGENPKNMDANLAVLERLTAQLRLNSDNQNRALERREALVRQLASSEGGAPAAVGVSGVEPVDSGTSRLARLHQELAELQTRFSDKYPDVVRAKAEIAALEAQMRSRPGATSTPAQPEAAVNPFAFKLRQTIVEIEAEIAALRSEERRLREDFATYQRRVENTPLREQEFQELSRDYETTSELYRTLLKRYEEAQLAETLEQRQKGEQFRILEPAVPPTSPWAPSPMRLVLLGGLVSVAAAVGAAMLAEWLDGSFHEVNQLRRVVSIPVVARIPRIVGEHDMARARWGVVAWAGAMLVTMTLTVGAAYATAKGHVPLVSRMTYGLLVRS